MFLYNITSVILYDFIKFTKIYKKLIIEKHFGIVKSNRRDTV